MSASHRQPRPGSRAGRRARRGLTLIELVVTLTILTALGGLLVPVIGNAINRTHLAKCSTTIPELSRQISRSFVTNLRYPNRWDSLMNDGGAALFSKLPGGDAGGNITAVTLTADDVAGLAAVGITEVVDLDPTINGDATWSVAPPRKTPRVLAAGDLLAGLVINDAAPPASYAVDNLNLKRHRVVPGTRYLVFGIGNNSTAVGPNGLFIEAPTHFGGEDVMNPRNVYQRYVAVFSIGPDGTARFETAAALHTDGLDGAEAHIRAFFDDTAG